MMHQPTVHKCSFFHHDSSSHGQLFSTTLTWPRGFSSGWHWVLNPQMGMSLIQPRMDLKVSLSHVLLSLPIFPNKSTCIKKSAPVLIGKPRIFRQNASKTAARMEMTYPIIFHIKASFLVLLGVMLSTICVALMTKRPASCVMHITVFQRLLARKNWPHDW